MTALLVIDALSLIVPAARRAAWRDQWHAELCHYAIWLARDGHGPTSQTLYLLARASGAIPHALQLRAFQWSPRMILQDLKFAWRMFVRRPAFTFVAVLILALGIGANTTIFSWTQALLLSPLAGVQRQDRILVINTTSPTRDALSMSYPNFQDLRAAQPDGVADLMAFRLHAMNLRGRAADHAQSDRPIRVFGELVTPNFFDFLGVRISQGRAFRPDEGVVPDRDAVAVISDDLWRRTFAADPATIGRVVTLNGRAFTIVGIAPPGFRGSAAAVALDVFVPLTMQRAVMGIDRMASRGSSWMEVYARLADGTSPATVQASVIVAGRRLATQYPDQNEGRGLRAAPLWRSGASNVLRPVLATLMGVVAIVLLIACANVAGLLLARAAGRQREIAVRLAVGASRWHVVRQLLVENLVLSAAGCAVGLLVARWAAGMLTAFVPRTPFPITFDASVDAGGVLFAMGLSVFTALVSGVVPALRASRPEVGTTLKEASPTGTGPRGRLRQLLVVAQVGLSVVLLVCAALFARSLTHAGSMDTGFSARQGLFASMDLVAGGYDETKGPLFISQLLEKLSALPQVTAATVAKTVPLDVGGSSEMGLTIDGYTPATGEDLVVGYNTVGPDYFETMGITVARGRGFRTTDVAGQPRIVVINETMAKRYWPGREAVGGTVRFDGRTATVAGVARDGKYQRLNESARPYLYQPVLQNFRPDMVLHVRTDGEQPGLLPLVQATVRSLDPGMALFDVRTIEEHMQISTFVPRMAASMLGLFGLLGVLLAGVGLYGVIAFNAAQRTREIGLRMALGAGRAQVIWLVLRDGFALALAGIAAGMALAFGAGRLVAGQLTGVSGADPVSFLGTAVLLSAVAAVACVLPARRASALNPLTALRRD
jgi:putative ABC transport system permease protein